MVVVFFYSRGIKKVLVEVPSNSLLVTTGTLISQFTEIYFNFLI